MKSPLEIKNPRITVDTIVTFISRVFRKNKKTKAVIGLSGGIDSALSLQLLTHAIGPDNILPFSLPLEPEQNPNVNLLLKQLAIPVNRLRIIPIRTFIVPITRHTHKNSQSSLTDKIRYGNIAARIRMILLFDFAKKHNALVCGTENKSEHLLGYYTRFGDGASDLEPIMHLYKTQVYQLAEFLHIPNAIITQPPTAGLWQNQTDENELGFSYEEADRGLDLHLKQHKNNRQIKLKGYPNAAKIIQIYKKNKFKSMVPYRISESF